MDDDVHEWRVFVTRPRSLFRRRPAWEAMQEELFESVLDILRSHGIAVEVEDEP